MRYFDQDPAYILEYVAYLEHINDDNNLRSLFERVLRNKGSPSGHQDSLGPIWRRFLNFELTMSADGGQLDAIEGVEGRRKLSSGLPGFEGVAHRYSFRGLCPDSADDAQYLIRARSANRDALKPSTSGINLGNERTSTIVLPPFLHKMVSMLPSLRHLQGSVPNVDILLAQLRDAPLPNRVHDARMRLNSRYEDGDLYQRRMGGRS